MFNIFQVSTVLGLLVLTTQGAHSGQCYNLTGCECLLYTATYGQDAGRFLSPDFPSSCPRGISCILYVFAGTDHEIVQLNLTTFHIMPTPHCSGDWLKIYSDLDRPEINEMTPWTRILCGILPEPRMYYSRKSYIVLELHTSSSSQPYPGFQGFFKFIDKSEFVTSGRLVPGTYCDYQFFSSNHTSTSGRFFSPEFPSEYPNDVICQYRFNARPNERIKIRIHELTLRRNGTKWRQGMNCGTDRITVIDKNRKPLVICTGKNHQMTSSTRYLMIEFRAGSGTGVKNGFTASYHFIAVNETALVTSSTETPTTSSANLGTVISERSIEPKVIFSSRLCEIDKPQKKCKLEIHSMRDSLKGYMRSPFWPSNYTESLQCRYEIVGASTYRITIKFHYFNTEGNGLCNNETDYLEISDGTNTTRYCGNVQPFVYESEEKKVNLTFFSNDNEITGNGFNSTFFFTRKPEIDDDSSVATLRIRIELIATAVLYFFVTDINLNWN